MTIAVHKWLSIQSLCHTPKALANLIADVCPSDYHATGYLAAWFVRQSFVTLHSSKCVKR